MAVASATVMNDIQRLKVLWLGAKFASINLDEFSHRNLHVEFPDPSVCHEFHTATALIFGFEPSKPASFKNLWEKFAKEGVNHGLLICVVIESVDPLPMVEKIIKEIKDKIERTEDEIKRTFPDLKSWPKYTPQSEIEILLLSNIESFELAEKIARHDPGPAENQELKIEINDTKFSDVQELLIKRAFFDCEFLTSIKLFEGRSGVKIFSALARIKGSPVGHRSLPFLIKLGDRRKIENEMVLYKRYVSDFIPFNLRPHLHMSRCLLGFEQAIIVGDFVEQSETLDLAAGRDAAQTAIYSIFDNAFRNWLFTSHPKTGNLVKPLLSVLNQSKMTNWEFEWRIKSVKKDFKVRHTPLELIEILKTLKEQTYLHSRIHSDLHTRNVLVRGSDAVLIDFAKIKEGPFVADLAALEVSLAFEDDGRDDKKWKELMDVLYQAKFLSQPFLLKKDPYSRDWLCKYVGQIRIIASGYTYRGSEYVYNTALAIYLLHRSMGSAKTLKQDFRWTYAYVLAEKVILEIAKKIGTK